MDFELLECNIEFALKSLLDIFTLRAEEKGITLTLDQSNVLYPNILIDSGRLRQILTNLVGNAIKFTHQGGVHINVSLYPNQEKTQGELIINITDTGIGIAQEKLPTLFDPFTQADGSTTRQYGGTGLGLSIVKRLCELMGGTIHATSIIGVGSTFSIHFNPLLGSDLPFIEEKPIDHNSEFKWPNHTRILLVEDNPTNQMVAVGMLEILGLEADIASNGQEAIEALKLASGFFPYTVVLMDCQMPIMDGYSATEAIRLGEAGDENRSVPIIAMTANAMSSDRDRCILSGMDDFLTKPVDLELLKAMLIKYLGGMPIEISKQSSVPEMLVSPSWNKEEALDRLGGKEKLLRRIIASFLEEAPNILDQLAIAIQNNHFEEAQLHAHSLKGSAANIGATSIQNITKKMEDGAKERDRILLEENFIPLEAVLNKTTKELHHYLNN